MSVLVPPSLATSLQPQASLVQLKGAAGGGGEQGSAHRGSTQATAEGVRAVGSTSPHCPVQLIRSFIPG